MQNNGPKYTQAKLGRFRKGLLKLLQDGPSYEGYGVCYNLNAELRTMPEFEWGDAYDFVDSEAYDWPYALYDEDGCLLSYFVPDRGGEPWHGENLKMRQNLIQYLLGRVAHHEAMLRGGVALAG
jgi:hypothetical protein